MAIAAIAACGNIRSILLSGPILSLTGFMVALLSFRAHRRVGFYFGLAAPTVAVTCLNLIAVFDWGPSEAHMPVGGMVVVLLIVSLPAGLVAVRECRRRALPQYPLPVQFSIASLLWTMLFVAVFFSCFRMGQQRGMAIVVLAGYSMFMWRLIRSFRGARGILSDLPSVAASNDRSVERLESEKQRGEATERDEG